MNAQFKFLVKKLCYITSQGEDINLYEGGELFVTQLAPSSHPDDCWLFEYVFESKVHHILISNSNFDGLRRQRLIEEEILH